MAVVMGAAVMAAAVMAAAAMVGVAMVALPGPYLQEVRAQMAATED